MITMIREFLVFYRQRRKERKDVAERAEIARLFNDRYTFRIRYTRDSDDIPGTGMCGKARQGFAWMCPECNVIHRPISINVFTGLQYPRCCSRFEGHRLHDGIRWT